MLFGILPFPKSVYVDTQCIRFLWSWYQATIWWGLGTEELNGTWGHVLAIAVTGEVGRQVKKNINDHGESHGAACCNENDQQTLLPPCTHKKCHFAQYSAETNSCLMMSLTSRLSIEQCILCSPSAVTSTGTSNKHYGNREVFYFYRSVEKLMQHNLNMRWTIKYPSVKQQVVRD